MRPRLSSVTLGIPVALLGQVSYEQLLSRGAGTGVGLILSRRMPSSVPSDHPIAQLFEHENSSVDWSLFHWRMLELFDGALGNLCLERPALEPWLSERLDSAWALDASKARGALTELEALGTLCESFSKVTPLKEGKTPTPDFLVDDRFCVEAYCPRVSTQDERSVADRLAKQSSFIKVAVSHPHTGSAGLSLTYPANKTAARFLNKKRASKQVRPDLPNILYVDARREWKLSSVDVLPLRTKHSLGEHWIGTFGAWHAFYGEQGRRTMLQDRASLRFLDSNQVHCQETTGLFRVDQAWSGSLIALTDGIVFFENPWAAVPLALDSLWKLFRLPLMRVEFSWFRSSESSCLAETVDNALDKIEHTFAALTRDELTTDA